MPSYQTVKAETIHEVEKIEARLDVRDVVNAESNTINDSFPCADQAGLLYTGQRRIEVTPDFDRTAFISTLQSDYADDGWETSTESVVGPREVYVSLVRAATTIDVFGFDGRDGLPMIIVESYSPCGSVDD